MKILLIRHAKVSMKWEQRYTPEEYDKACSLYDKADILPVENLLETGDYERIYVSELKRSVETAKKMFPFASDTMFTQTSLLNEVPLMAYVKDHKSRAKWLYDIGGRLQWRFGNKQKETCSETCARADELIKILEEKNENAILVTHGIFIEVLIRRLKKRRRYEFCRESTFFTSPLEKIKVIDKQPHCGGCSHNCLLSQAGCLIGQDKAKKVGL